MLTVEEAVRTQWTGQWCDISPALMIKNRFNNKKLCVTGSERKKRNEIGKKMKFSSFKLNWSKQNKRIPSLCNENIKLYHKTHHEHFSSFEKKRWKEKCSGNWWQDLTLLYLWNMLSSLYVYFAATQRILYKWRQAVLLDKLSAR